MRVRYTVNDRGELVDRHGAILGRLHSLTIEVPGRRGTTGGYGEVNQEHRLLSPNESEGTEGGVGETAIDAGTADADVVEVWAYWVTRRQPRFQTLEPSQAKLIRKGIAAVGVDGLKRAIDGLLASDFHRDKKLLQLSAILKTRPGGATLRDQLEGFIERSPSPAPTSVGPPAPDALIARLRDGIARYSAKGLRPGDYWHRDELVRRLLEDHGVQTIFDDGFTPRFVEPPVTP